MIAPHLGYKKREDTLACAARCELHRFGLAQKVCTRALCVRNAGINDLKWTRSKQEPFAHVCTTVLIVGIAPNYATFLRPSADAFPSWIIAGRVRCTSHRTREKVLSFYCLSHLAHVECTLACYNTYKALQHAFQRTFLTHEHTSTRMNVHFSCFSRVFHESILSPFFQLFRIRRTHRWRTIVLDWPSDTYLYARANFCRGSYRISDKRNTLVSFAERCAICDNINRIRITGQNKSRILFFFFFFSSPVHHYITTSLLLLLFLLLLFLLLLLLLLGTRLAISVHFRSFLYTTGILYSTR